MFTQWLVAHHELKACETTDPHTGGRGNHNEVTAFSSVLFQWFLKVTHQVMKFILLSGKF